MLNNSMVERRFVSNVLMTRCSFAVVGDRGARTHSAHAATTDAATTDVAATDVVMTDIADIRPVRK